LGADVITLALPVAAGGGIAVRAITKAEDVVGVVGVARTINRTETSFRAATKPKQMHHFLSPKHSRYTELFERITKEVWAGH
jgi:hypothetical protein